MWWGFWDGLRRGRVRICCKGAPGRDRWREEARNIDDSLSALRRDGGLCNRFEQPAPPRPPGGASWTGRRSRRTPRRPRWTRGRTARPARTRPDARARTSSRRAHRLSDVLTHEGKFPRAPSDHQDAHRSRRPPRGTPPEVPRRHRLSESVAKARIPPKHRKRIVDIPRFFSRPIPARSDRDRKSVV